MAIPGKKICPNCEGEIGRRARTCPLCYFDYEDAAYKASLEKASSTTTVRIGDKEVDVTTRKRHPFECPKLEVERVYNRSGYRNIVTPAGKCPVAFRGDFSQESIDEWVYAVRQAGWNSGLNFYPNAVRYFARQFWKMTTSAPGVNLQFSEACLMIDQSFADSL